MKYRHPILIISSTVLWFIMTGTAHATGVRASQIAPGLCAQTSVLCFYSLRTYNVYMGFPILIMALYVFFAMVTHSFLSIREALGWRKLKPMIRAAIENKDISLAVRCCQQYKQVSVSTVLSAIATGAMTMRREPATLDMLEQAGSSALRNEVSKWSRSIPALSIIAFVSVILPLVATIGELTRQLTFFASAEEAEPGVWYLISTIYVASPFLASGLAVALCSYVVRYWIVAETRRLESTARDLSVDLIVAALANRKKPRRITYKPQMWMDWDNSANNLPGSSGAECL